MSIALSFVFDQNKSGWRKKLCQQIYPLIQECNIIYLKLFGENFVTNKNDINFRAFSGTMKIGL